MKTIELAKALAVAATVLAAGSAAAPAAAQAIVEYYHLDAIGSIRAVTDASGNVVERHDYLPFGEEWCGTAACGSVTPGQPRRFTGKERDAETELDYFGARYYESHIGRFTTTDPVQTWQENLVDPQRWNRYAYARNNPLRFTDPTGAVLELTGKDRKADFRLIQAVAGPGAGYITMAQRGDRTFVEFGGGNSDYLLSCSSEIGAMLANLITTDRTVEFQTTTERFVPARGIFGTSLMNYRDLGLLGGAATLDRGESANGNTHVYVNPASVDWMNRVARSPAGVPAGVSGLYYTLATIAAHELGHAEADVIYDIPTRNAFSNFWAVFTEDLYRQREGMALRTTH